MEKEQQERLIKTHLKNLLMQYADLVNKEDREESDKIKNDLILPLIDGLMRKGNLSKKQKEKLLSFKAGVNEEAKDLEKRYKEFVASL